jgi:DNA helicase HerA-like ATPase
MAEPILVGKRDAKECYLLPDKANRHGLITGATGTGKTVTLQTIGESFSRIGVPVFMADIKGDLTGISQAGGGNSKVDDRLGMLGLNEGFGFEGSPVTLWDVFGEQGHPLRATVSEMGPLMLARILQLNDVQAGVLTLCFKIADTQGLLLLDFKDLRALLQYVGDNADQFTSEYGNVSKASVGAIQRGLLELENQGAEHFFGEPAVKLDDFMQTIAGKGVINILAADKLFLSPKLYSTFLLWLLSELFEMLPEAGDLEKPKLVFFFDEAHLLFSDTPQSLVEKIEQVVRLIRSKGVGVYFVTQNPIDIPDVILGQLGNRVQHALRAFTPRDQKAVRSAAETFRQNPEIDVETAITELGVGEALISFLDEKGTPCIVERAFVVPPHSRIGPVTPEQRQQLRDTSIVAGQYEQVADRESAYEILKGKADNMAALSAEQAEAEAAAAEIEAQRVAEEAARKAEETAAKEAARGADRSSRSDSTVEAFAKSAARAVGSNLGRQIVRGVLGSIFGGGSKKKSSWF